MTSSPTTNIPVAIPAGTPARGSGGQQRTIAGSLPAARSVASRLLHGTPGRMRLFALLGALAAIVLGAVSANALLSSLAAVERAANNTAQVVRAQSIHVDLLRADALATNAFLVGGLESPESRAEYESAMDGAAENLAEAAAAQPADGDALGALSVKVQSYVAHVEQARANNRLGLPVGAQYLKEASAGLRSDAIPIIDNVVTANEQRARDEFDRSNSSLQLLVGVLCILGLLAVAVWLSRRTHRYLNPSLTAAIAIVGVALFLAASTISGIGNATSEVSDGNYATAVRLADVTTAANDARANESLTLIARGSGSSFEEKWKADDKAVRAGLDALGDERASLTESWNRYAETHKQVRQLDDTGQWDKAVALSTSSADEGAAARFAAFDKEASQARDAASTAAVSTLEGLGGSAPWWALVVTLAALVAAWLVIRGFGQRIEEYR